MREQPSFNQIAELFQLELPDEDALPVSERPKKKVGRGASESEELGREALSAGDADSAIKHYRKASDQRGNKNADTLVDLASAYDYAEQAPQALRQYEKALRLRKDSPEPNLGVADLYKRRGRYKEAIEKLENAIQADQANPFYRIKLAETFREMGEPLRALEAAQSAIVVKPDGSFYHYWIGDLLIELKRYPEALASLRAAIELSPGDDFLYQRACVAFWCSGKKTEAIKAARLASDLDPEKNLYHGLLELLLRANGMNADADLEQKSASKMDRFDRDLLRRMADEMGLSV